jgi:hypothetical protein
VDNRFVGDSFTRFKRPGIRLVAKGGKPIARIELVRNSRCILTEYQDESALPGFYYVRITQAPGE